MPEDNILIGARTPIPISASAASKVRVTKGAGATVYYKNESNVSSVSNDGSLTTTGQSETFTAPTWFISTTAKAKLFVERIPSQNTDMATQAELDAKFGILVPELRMVSVRNALHPDKNSSFPIAIARDPNTGTTPTVPAAAPGSATPTAILYAAWGPIVSRSPDDGVTWEQRATLAGYTVIEHITVLSDGTVLVVARNGSSEEVAHDILRSEDEGATFTPVAAQPLTREAPFTNLLSSISWCETGAGDIYLGEYKTSAAVTEMRILKSSDKGKTWSVAVTFNESEGPFATIRHVHSVQEDPFKAGRIWVCTGDKGNNGVVGHSRIIFTDDGFATVTVVTYATKTGVNLARSRAAGVNFTNDAVFWYPDEPDAVTALWRYDRGTGEITALPNSYPNTGVGITDSFTLPDGTEILLKGLAVEPPTQVGRDDLLRMIGSADGGNTWHELFAWPRSDADQTKAGYFTRFTSADADGAFWVILGHVKGAEYGDGIAIKFITGTRLLTANTPGHANHFLTYKQAGGEGTLSLTHPSTAGAGVTTALKGLPLWKAPAQMWVRSFDVFASGAVAASETKYWTITLGGYDETGALKVVIGQVGGKGVEIKANQKIPQLLFAGATRLNEGYFLGLEASVNGEPTALKDLTVTAELRRINTI